MTARGAAEVEQAIQALWGVSNGLKRCPDCDYRFVPANVARCFVCQQQTECDDSACLCHEGAR